MPPEVVTVHPEFPEIDAMMRAGRALREGRLVVFPTETVYGVGADGDDPRAVARLREVKRRPPDKPFAILIAFKEEAADHSPSARSDLYKVIDACWPGPVTVVAPGFEGTAVGLRLPDHPVARRLVQEARCPVLAPSANVAGAPPPLTCAEALARLGGEVDLAVDAGPSRIGRPSTVVDFTGEGLRILRAGAVPADEIEGIARRKHVLFVCTGNSCRSVMAEYLLREALRRRGRDDVVVESAGTSVFLRCPASRETVEALAGEGIDASRHLSRPVTPVTLKKSDLILVMTRSHRDQIVARTPEVQERVYLLREFCGSTAGVEGRLDIPDPMGRPAEAYAECLAVVKEAVGRLAELL